MITFMFNLAANPTHQEVTPHKSASYEMKLHECDHCNHKQINYLHVPGSVHKFESKERMLEELTKYASDLWDKAEESSPSLPSSP